MKPRIFQRGGYWCVHITPWFWIGFRDFDAAYSVALGGDIPPKRTIKQRD